MGKNLQIWEILVDAARIGDHVDEVLVRLRHYQIVLYASFVVCEH